MNRVLGLLFFIWNQVKVEVGEHKGIMRFSMVFFSPSKSG